MTPTRLLFLYAAGSNGRGQLAIADEQDAHSFTPCAFHGCQRGTLPPGTLSVIAIRSCGNHSLALLSRPPNPRLEVWGSGDGTKGQLGPTYVTEAGDSSTIFRPIVLPLENHALSGYEISDVATCWETSFFLLTKEGQHDVLISMGGNDFGDLGVGGPGTANALPFHIINFTHIVDHIADRLSITNIATGPHHAIALLRAGNKQYIAGWGTARHGQLGPLHAPSGRPLPFSPSPVAINLPIDIQHDPVRTVRAGNQHTLFLHASGRISSLGSDAKGQLRGLRTAEDVQAIGCSWNGSYLQTSMGLLSAGANAHGQLGREGGASEASLGSVNVPDARRVVDFACGSEHVLCVLNSEGGRAEVWGWGWNEHGNLATGSLDDVKAPVRIWLPSPAQAKEKVVGVWAGCGTSWIAVVPPASLHES